MAGEEKKEIVEKVKQIISEQLGVDENEVTPSASFVDDLGADSLDQVELVMALEEHRRFRRDFFRQAAGLFPRQSVELKAMGAYSRTDKGAYPRRSHGRR